MQGHINAGPGKDIAFAQFAEIISKVIGYQGEISFDISRPDGVPRKLMDSSRLNNLGWSSKNRNDCRMDACIQRSYATTLICI